jgi:hypothetical protein
MIIVWRGWGILVLAILFGCSLAANMLVNHLTGTTTYWETHAWPFASALLSAAALMWWVGLLLDRYSVRKSIDRFTGAPVATKKNHDLFYIPIKYWGLLFLALGLLSLLTNHVPGPSRARASDNAAHRPQP